MNPDDAEPRIRVGMIWAQGLNGVIGLDGAMPWHLPEDLRHFRELTVHHPVVMGRRTWESFPQQFRPLPDRTNVVVSRTLTMDDEIADQQAPGAVVVPDFQSGLNAAMESDGLDRIWVIGGSSIYEQALDVATVVERTVINLEPEGDTSAPELDESWQRTSLDPAEGWSVSSTGLEYRFERWERVESNDD
ncbi:MAG: dihydrofolate reductase [Micrococcaceae bacterium]